MPALRAPDSVLAGAGSSTATKCRLCFPQGRLNPDFGSQHFFRLGGMPVIYMGYPRFKYDGFSFLMADPWPGHWSENRYVSDDVYVDYDDLDNRY